MLEAMAIFTPPPNKKLVEKGFGFRLQNYNIKAIYRVKIYEIDDVRQNRVVINLSVQDIIVNRFSPNM